MRVGILGSGPAAILAAAKIIELEGSPVLFSTADLGQVNLSRITTQLSDGSQISYGEFLDNHLSQLVDQVRTNCDTHLHCELRRIGKKFLADGQQVEGKSRLADLFRIVYTTDPKEGVLKQVADNPEIFEKLGADVLESLQEPIEEAEDVDIIIDARERLFNNSYNGVRGEVALNEYKWKDYIFYGPLTNESHLYLKGKVFLNLNEPKFQKQFITHLLDGWDSIESLVIVKNSDVNIDELLDRDQKDWDVSSESFHEDMLKWKSLEEYEKVKIAKPKEPLKKIQYYDEYRVMSVDRLLDQDSFFITCEYCDFLGQEELKTFGIDQMFCCNYDVDNLITDEVGQFSLAENVLEDSIYRFDLIDKKIDSIIQSILTYFKKA